MILRVRVYGLPKTQGSLQPFRNRRTGKIGARHARELEVWRELVAIEAQRVFRRDLKRGAPHDGPAAVRLHFYVTRPRTVRRRQTPWKNLDLDKLERACFDALERAGVVANDSRFIESWCRKDYADDNHPPGVAIEVALWTEGQARKTA